MITVTINGRPHQLEGPLTIARLLEHLGLSGRFVAVARNGEVVPRDAYTTTQVVEGDVLEIVRPVGGG